MTKNYQSEEFPELYNDFIHGVMKNQEVFVAGSLQNIYQSGRLPGTKLLEFGCGPIVHRIASASAQFNDITLAEWSESNRKALEKWLRGEKDALDWTPSLEICARAEGFRNLEEGVAKIEKRVRQAVKKVIPCDILEKDILPIKTEEFDVVNCSYCLEGCISTSAMYKEAVKKLTKHVRKGGALVMVTVIEGHEYTFNGKVLPCLYLTSDIIKEALADAGLQLKDWFEWRDTKSYEEFKYGGTVICYAVKM